MFQIQYSYDGRSNWFCVNPSSYTLAEFDNAQAAFNAVNRRAAEAQRPIQNYRVVDLEKLVVVPRPIEIGDMYEIQQRMVGLRAENPQHYWASTGDKRDANLDLLKKHPISCGVVARIINTKTLQVVYEFPEK